MYLTLTFVVVFVFQGHFVRKLGNVGDKDTENEVLLLEHDVPHSKFSEAVLACLPKLPWIITDEVSENSHAWIPINGLAWLLYSGAKWWSQGR